MSLPGDLNTVTVTGSFLDASGAPLTGSVTFTPVAVLAAGSPAVPVTVTDSTGHVIIAAVGVTRLVGPIPPSTGRIPATPPLTYPPSWPAQPLSVNLAATDNADLSPQNWAYQASVVLGDAPVQTFTTLLPHSPPTIDFTDLVPATLAVALSAALPITGGVLSGTLELGGSPPLQIPAGAAAGDVLVSDASGNASWDTLSAAGLATTTALAAETSRAEAAEELKAPLASPALTGTPTAPTKTALTDSTAIATTAYADAAVGVETSRAETAEAALVPLSYLPLSVAHGGSGSMTAPGSTAYAAKAASTEKTIYVSLSSAASDSNDGLSIGSAKATIAGALTALGGGAGKIQLGYGTWTISSADGNGNGVSLALTQKICGLGRYLTVISINCAVTWGIQCMGAGCEVSDLTLECGASGSCTYAVGVQGPTTSAFSAEECLFERLIIGAGSGTMTNGCAISPISSSYNQDVAETHFWRVFVAGVTNACFLVGCGIVANILNTYMYGCGASQGLYGVYCDSTNFVWDGGTAQHNGTDFYFYGNADGAESVIQNLRSENSGALAYSESNTGGQTTVEFRNIAWFGVGGSTYNPPSNGQVFYWGFGGVLSLSNVQLQTATSGSSDVQPVIYLSTGTAPLTVNASGLISSAPYNQLFVSVSAYSTVTMTGYVQLNSSTNFYITGYVPPEGPVTLAYQNSVTTTINGTSYYCMVPIQSWTGLRTPTAVKAANYTASPGDHVLTNTSSGSLTVTLPSAPANDTVIGVEQVTVAGVGTNATTVACGGSDVFDQALGATSFTMSLLRQSVLLQYNSGVWTRQAISDPFGQVANSRHGVWYLDSYTGTDDAKMVSALTAVFAAGGGTIQLSPRSHTFANQWSTSYGSGTVTPLRILGAGAVANDVGGTNIAGATACAMSYASSGAARMDFQHIGSIEIAGILFEDSGGSSVPFFQTTNATPYIHDNAFVGSATGASCFQDAIVVGGTGTTVGAGDTAPYQGYQGRICGNSFSGIRRIVLFQTYANSVEVHENLVIGTCGSNLQLGGCIEFNSTVTCAGNHVWGNCIEMVHYPCFVRGTSGCSNNTLGPNGLFDATATTIAYYVFLPNAAAGNYYNQVIDGYKNDTYPFILDGTNTANIQTIHQAQWSVTLQPQVFGNTVNFSYAPQVYLRDLNGDAAMVYPVLDAANSGGFATIALASANCSQVSDGQTYSSSNWLVSLSSATFASGDLFQPISGTGVPNLSYVQRIATPSTAIPWFASGTYALGDIARPTSSNSHLYQCTTAGTASSSQPTWPTGGGTVTDGSVVWQDLGTSATAVYMSLPATATNSSVTIRWGRMGTTNVYAEFKRFHFLSQGGTPSGAADSGAGSSPSAISTTGTDHAFTFNITTGSSGTATGDMFHVVPAQAWTGTPNFNVTAGNSATASLLAGGWYYTNTSGTLTFYAVNAPATATAYVFHVIAMV